MACSKILAHPLSLLLLLTSAVPLAYGQTTYSLGPEVPLLDEAFYMQGSNGYSVFNAAPANDGKTVAFRGLPLPLSNTASVYVVDLGDPTSWRIIRHPYPTDLEDPLNWTPNDYYIIEGRLLLEVPEPNEIVPIQDVGFWDPGDTDATSRPVDNWMITEIEIYPAGPGDLGREIFAVPVTPYGDRDHTRDYVRITDTEGDNFGNGNDFEWPTVSPDLSTAAFFHQEYLWFNTWEQGDIYTIPDFDDIVNAPLQSGSDLSTQAITSLTDPKLVAIDTDPEFSGTPSLTEDGSLVLYGKEWNREWVSGSQFFTSLADADFDIMIAPSDGSEPPYRIVEPGNQGFPVMTRGGPRVVYVRDVSGTMRLFAAPLIVETAVTGTVVGPPADNVIETTQDIFMTDGSGTSITIPAGTQIDFPDGAEAKITMHTPVEPVTQGELPADIVAMNTVRRFGPTGTQFDGSVSVTMAFTEPENDGHNTAALGVYRLNEGSGMYDEPVAGATVDAEGGSLTFNIDHFSAYGVGQISDIDFDGIPDAEDPDRDGDSIPNETDPMPDDSDNDGINNDVDDDPDGDADDDEEFPFDTDNDGINNGYDEDDDGDGIPDHLDPFIIDTDNDGVPNYLDPDSDNDGLADHLDPHVFDTDNDGLRNDVDPDDDNDGLWDEVERAFGSDPLSAGEIADVPAARSGLLVVLGLCVAMLGAAGVRRRFARQ